MSEKATPERKNNDTFPALERLAKDKGADETDGNRVRLFFDADETYDAILEAVGKAEHFIHMEMYMFQEDEIGHQISTALKNAARRGVEVALAFDAIGSNEASDEFFESMREAGMLVNPFRPLAPWRKHRGVLGRNHRKNIIIDGHTGFSGGMNIGKLWSKRVNGDEAWRDTHLCIKGPAVRSCHNLFLETWKKVGGEDLSYQFPDDLPKADDGCRVIVVNGRGFGKRKAIRRLFTTAIKSAQREFLLTVPYFMPPPRFIKLLKKRASNCDITILVPQNSDIALADWFRISLYQGLTAPGIKVMEYLGSVLHAKTVVADGHISIVGSANFDFLSMAMNWEMALVIEDEEIARQLKAQFEKDCENAEEVDPDTVAQLAPWWRRALGKIAVYFIRGL